MKWSKEHSKWCTINTWIHLIEDISFKNASFLGLFYFTTKRISAKPKLIFLLFIKKQQLKIRERFIAMRFLFIAFLLIRFVLIIPNWRRKYTYTHCVCLYIDDILNPLKIIHINYPFFHFLLSDIRVVYPFSGHYFSLLIDVIILSFINHSVSHFFGFGLFFSRYF